MAIPALVNGVRHGWSNIRLNALGRTFTGITEVEYGHKLSIENHYGAGNKVVGRGKGNEEPEAKMKLYKYEVDAIIAALPAGSKLTDVAPFDVVVSYLPEGGDGLVNDVIRNCQFMEHKVSVKQGDMMIEIDLPLVVSDIEYNQ